jgi:hypothetical protein
VCARFAHASRRLVRSEASLTRRASQVEALEREGVDLVFAYPGGASMEIHQALTRSNTIRNILCRHEQVRATSPLHLGFRFSARSPDGAAATDPPATPIEPVSSVPHLPCGVLVERRRGCGHPVRAPAGCSRRSDLNVRRGDRGWGRTQGEIFAAEGYSKVTGKTSVCIATSGPGATNLVTGLADAMLDSIPMVAITGQVPRPMIGTDAFQVRREPNPSPRNPGAIRVFAIGGWSGGAALRKRFEAPTES